MIFSVLVLRFALFQVYIYHKANVVACITLQWYMWSIAEVNKFFSGMMHWELISVEMHLCESCWEMKKMIKLRLGSKKVVKIKGLKPFLKVDKIESRLCFLDSGHPWWYLGDTRWFTRSFNCNHLLYTTSHIHFTKLRLYTFEQPRWESNLWHTDCREDRLIL